MDHFQNPHPILSSSGEESSEDISIESQQPDDFALIKSSFIQQKSDRDIVWELTSSNNETVDTKQPRVSVSSLKQKFERKIAEVKGLSSVSPLENEEKEKTGSKLTKEEIINEIKQERKKTVGATEEGDEDGLRIKYEHNLLSFENRDLKTKLDQANRQMIDMKKESDILNLELERERLDKEIMKQETLSFKDESNTLRLTLKELINRYTEANLPLDTVDLETMVGFLEQILSQNAGKLEDSEVKARREKAESQEILSQMDGFKQMIQYFEKELENFKQNEQLMHEEKNDLIKVKDELEQTLNQEREEFSSKVTSIQADITAILQAKDEQIAKLTDDLMKTNFNNDAPHSSLLEDYEAKLHLYEGKMKVLSETVESLRKSESELKSAMSAKADEYAKTLFNLEIERSQLQDENEDLKTNQQINLGNKDFEMAKYIEEAKTQRKTCKDFEAKINELDAINKDLKLKLEETQSTCGANNKAYEEEKNELLRKLEGKEKALENETAAKKSLEIQLEILQKTIEGLTGEVSEICENKMKDASELTLEREKNTRFWEQINSLTEELKNCKLELNKKIEDNQNLLEKLEESKAVNTKESEVLRSEISALTENVEKLKKAVSGLQSDKLSLEDRTKNLEGEKLEKEKEVKAFEEKSKSDISRLNEELKEYSSNFEALKEEHTHLLKTFTATRETLEKTEKKLARHQTDYDEKIKLVQQDFQKSAEESSLYLSNEIKFYKDKLNALTEEKSIVDEVIVEIGGKLETKEAECEKLLDELKLLKESNLTLKEQEALELRLSLQNLQNETADLAKALDTCKAEKENFERLCTQTNHEKKELEDNFKEVLAKLEIFEKEITNINSNNEKKLIDSEQTIKSLRENLDERDKNYSEKEMNFKTGLETLEISLSGMQTDIDKYIRENAALVQDKQTLQQLCDIGRAEREKLLREMESIREKLLIANKESTDAMESLIFERNAKKELESKISDYEEKLEILSAQRASLPDSNLLSGKLSEAIKLRDSYENKATQLSEELEKVKLQHFEATQRLAQHEEDSKREQSKKEKLIEENDVLNNELEVLKIAIEESLSRIKRRDEDYEELKATLEQIIDQKESALLEITDLRDELQEQRLILKEREDAASEDKKVLERSIELKENELTRNQREFARKEEILKEYVENSEREKKENDHKLQSLQKDLSLEKQKALTLEAERESLLKSFTDVQTTIKFMEEKLQGYAQQGDKVRGENQGLRLKVGELEELLNQTRISSRVNEDELITKNKELQELKNMYSQLATEREVAGNARVQELARLKNENNELRFSVEGLLKERENLQNERLKLTAVMKNLETSLYTEKETYNKLVSEKDKLLSASLSDYQNSLKLAEEISSKKLAGFEERNIRLEKLLFENEKTIQSNNAQILQLNEKIKSLSNENSQLKNSENLLSSSSNNDLTSAKISELEEKIKEEATSKKSLQFEINKMNKQVELLRQNLYERDKLLDEMKNAMEAIDIERKEKEKENFRANTERKTVSESYEHKLFLKDLLVRDLQSKIKELEGKKAGDERLSVTGSARGSERRLNKSVAPSSVYTGGYILEVQEEVTVASFEEKRIEKEVRSMNSAFQSVRVEDNNNEIQIPVNNDQMPMSRPSDKLLVSKRDEYDAIEIMGDVNILKEKVIIILKKFEKLLERTKRERRSRPFDEAKEQINAEIKDISSNYFKLLLKYFSLPEDVSNSIGQSKEVPYETLQAIKDMEFTMQSEKDQEINETINKINDFLTQFLKNLNSNQAEDQQRKSINIIPEEDHPSQDQRRSVSALASSVHSQIQAPSKEEIRRGIRESIFKEKYKTVKKTSTEGIEMFCKKCEEFKPCMIYEYHSCISNPAMRKLKNSSMASNNFNKKQLKDLANDLGLLVNKFETNYFDDLKGDAILKNSWEKLRTKFCTDANRQELPQIRRILEELALFGDGIVKKSGLRAFLKRFEIIYEKLSEEIPQKQIIEEEGVLLTPEHKSSKFYKPLRVDAILSD